MAEHDSMYKITEAEYNNIGYHYLCQTCLDERFFFCYRCKHLFNRRVRTTYNHHYYCRNCAFEEARERSDKTIDHPYDHVQIVYQPMWGPRYLVYFYAINSEMKSKICVGATKDELEFWIKTGDKDTLGAYLDHLYASSEEIGFPLEAFANVNDAFEQLGQTYNYVAFEMAGLRGAILALRDAFGLHEGGMTFDGGARLRAGVAEEIDIEEWIHITDVHEGGDDE